MKSHVTLLLFCMLFSKALSTLTCQHCPLSGSCNWKTCKDQCLTATISVAGNGIKSKKAEMKTCGTSEMCAGGSMNLGDIKMTVNAKCCKANKCTEKPPASSKTTTNGNMCYTCEGFSCLEKIRCKGSEDHCITASVQRESMKGCISKNLCTADGRTAMSAIGATNLKCCTGNLCNGVERFTLSLILMIVPLISSFLFY